MGVIEFAFEFVQGKVHDVVVMDFKRCNIVAEFEPNSVQEVDLLGGEVWRVRPEVKDVFLPPREVDHQRQLRFGIGQVLPRESRQTSFLRDRTSWRRTQDDHRRRQSLS